MAEENNSYSSYPILSALIIIVYRHDQRGRYCALFRSYLSLATNLLREIKLEYSTLKRFLRNSNSNGRGMDRTTASANWLIGLSLMETNKAELIS